MKITSVSFLKNNLSAQLKEVIAGESILITDRRQPIATLQPLGRADRDKAIVGLSSRGVVSPAGQALKVTEFLSRPRGESDGAGLTDAILQERENR